MTEIVTGEAQKMGSTPDFFNVRIAGKGKSTRCIKSGVWTNLRGVRVDGRSRIGKWLGHLIGELTKHVGGDPSITQAIVIDGLALKVLRRHFYNTQFFKNKDIGSRDHILALENSIRLDCMALGLERRAKKILDLAEYLKSKAEDPASSPSSDGAPEVAGQDASPLLSSDHE